jgi:hypothetical protein
MERFSNQCEHARKEFSGKTYDEIKGKFEEEWNGKGVPTAEEIEWRNRFYQLDRARKTQHVAKSNTDEKNAADTLSKKLTFMHILSALNPKNWFSRSEPELTQEDIAKTEDMLRRLKVEVAPEKNFEGRFLKEFRRRLRNNLKK